MIHAYLLAFSLMAAVPVLLHMLKKGQPKRVIFPAIRFLLERQQKSRRRSQLQNLLLLLLRMAIIVLACLALARPLLPNPGIDLGQGAQVRAVVILDRGRQPRMTRPIACWGNFWSAFPLKAGCRSCVATVNRYQVPKMPPPRPAGAM